MKLRVLLLIGFFGLLGVAVNLRGDAPSKVHDEAWLEQNTPTKVGNYEMVPGPDGGLQTYHMNRKTVEALHAAATVCRVFDSGEHRFEVVVITSDRGESFHDPAGCFKAQDWVVSDQKPVTIQTKQGPIDINSLSITHVDSTDKLAAAYFFRHQSKFFWNQNQFVRSLFFGELLSATRQEGFMFRVIAQDPKTTTDQLAAFTASYIDGL